MPPHRHVSRTLAGLAIAAGLLLPAGGQAQVLQSCLEEGEACWSDGAWADPPNRFRPLVRWWWPGGQVDDATISRELALFDSLGFGGVEVQPFAYGIVEDQVGTARVRSVGSAAFFDRVDHAIAQARRRSLSVDLTMSSGWGLGGPLDCGECGTHQLLMEAFDVDGPVRVERPLPRPRRTPFQDHPVGRLLGLTGTFDPDLVLVAVLAGRIRGREGTDSAGTVVLEDGLLNLTDGVREGRLSATLPAGAFRVFVVYRNRTNTRLAGAAYEGDPATFRTIDHLDAAGLRAFEASYFDRLVAALRQPPDHFFVDSFEFLADVPWTPPFLGAFEASRGYDLRPYLPLLFDHGGDHSFAARTTPRARIPDVSERVREDYQAVRAELFRREFIEPLVRIAHAAGARLRLQALGGYGDFVETFAAADVPEAEDFGLLGAFDFLKLASSAAHVAGRPRASSEAFVRGLPAGSRGLSESDYHRMAGRAFAAGIDQLVYHGRAYPFVDASGASWYPFERLRITTRLDQANPVWARLPHLNATFARLSYAMTRGRPVARIAWLVAGLEPQELELLDAGDLPGFEPYRELSDVGRTLRRHGIGYDRVSRPQLVAAGPCDGKVCIGQGRYDLVLVDHAATASLDWLRRLRVLAAAGIPVVIVGPEPQRATGYADAQARDAAVRDAMVELRAASGYHRVEDVSRLGELLDRLVPDRLFRPVDPTRWAPASAERALADEDVLLLFNGSATDEAAAFEVLRPGLTGILVLDPEATTAVQRVALPPDGAVTIEIPAGRTRVLRFLRGDAMPAPPPANTAQPPG